MSDEELKEELEKVKSECCNSEWYRKGRASLRCKKCDKDMAMELVLLSQILSE